VVHRGARAGGRRLTLDFVLLQQEGSAIVPRKLSAALTLPEGADSEAPLAGVAVCGRAGTGLPSDEELTARVAALLPTRLRRLLRVCAALDAALQEGLAPPAGAPAQEPQPLF